MKVICEIKKMQGDYPFIHSSIHPQLLNLSMCQELSKLVGIQGQVNLD